MENNSWRKGLAAGVAILYSATNVLFCHSAEAGFWSARREAARKVAKNGVVSAPSSRSSVPTDALVLAQLPGGARFDVHSPAPAYVTPVPAKEHLVGGKVPVFSSDLPRWLGEVVTPFGNIRDVHLSKRPGAPLVIHIQDLHDSTEAQRNIAGLVEALQDERGVSLVGLEGAQGAFATEAFRAFPDAEITKAVATYFMDEGYMGGPEFAGITAQRMPLLWGVEDMKRYDANVNAVKESAQTRPALELFLREARTLLNEIKTRRLSPALLEFDRNFSAYQSRKMPLGAYVRYLLKSSPSGAARAPNLVLLRDALTWEDSLDFPRIERERASLLEQMVQVLPKQQLKNLVDKSALYRLGRISYGDYYRFFRSLCEENGIPLTAYRQLHAYVRYVLLAERINRNDLLNELSALELGAQDQLISHPRERRVVNAARHLGQLERLVRHSYTPADWGYHILHEDEIRNVGLTVRALAKDEGLPETLSPPSVEMLKPFENFCLQALGRNGAMVSNLLEKMAAEKRPSAVLVAGGFHTDGMTQLFRQKDVSYVVVTPKINGELPDGHRTLDILARDPAPLEKLFAGQTVNIPMPGMTNLQNAVTNPLARKFATLFVVISLGLTVATNQSSASTPNNLPSPLSATASPVPGTSDARVKMGEKVFRVQMGSEETSSPLEAYTAPIPGFGTVRVRGETPFSFALQFTELKGWVWRNFENRRTAVSNGLEISWEWVLGLMGVGAVRRVGGRITTQGVTPAQPVPRSGDSTSNYGSFTLSTLSLEGQILLALERLSELLPPGGNTKNSLIANIQNGFYLREMSDRVRKGLVEEFEKWGLVDEEIVTAQFIKTWVSTKRSRNSQLGPYILQKPATFRLLESWKSENGIKGLLARHDVWGTALLEELGVPGRWRGLFEGRLPAALAGAFIGTLAVFSLMSWAQMALLAFVMAGVWNVMGPQKKFVADHGKDQTRVEIVVRSFGTFLLNLVAISVSAVLIYVAADPGIGAALSVMSFLSPVLGLMAAVGVHALFELVDVFPGPNSSLVDFETGAPKNPDVRTDPLSINNSKPEKFNLVGKTIAQLDQILRMAADHDLGGSDNDYLNKHANGVLGTPSANDVVATSKNFSPYWWQRFWIRAGIEKTGGFVEKGEGGDDYKITIGLDQWGDKNEVEAHLQAAVDFEHDRMRDQFAFYSIYQGGKQLDRDQEIRVTAEFTNELANDGRMVIVRHGNGLTLAVRRETPQDTLGSIENRLRGLSSLGLSFRRLDDTRLGLGLFAYSMGGQTVGDVVRRLQEETKTSDAVWFDSKGGLLPERVRDLEEWSDRLAEDMLGVAKGRGRRQAFLAPDLDTVMAHERKGTVATFSIEKPEEGSPTEVNLHSAFKSESNHDFWEKAKKSVGGPADIHVVVFEVAQYRRQPVTVFGISLSEVVLRYLDVRVGKFIPPRWVQGLEKRIQSRAFHSWQGTDQKGKGNFGIEQHFEYAKGVLGNEPAPGVSGRSVDTFSFSLRGPPSFGDRFDFFSENMKKALKDNFPEEEKVDPYHIVYDINVTKWLKFLDELNRERDQEGVPVDRPGDQFIQKRPHLTIEDVMAMQNAVVTFLGRRHGRVSLARELGAVFDVLPGRDHLLLSMAPTKEKLAELERIYRQAQAANARAAELVLRARAPAQLGSVLFNRLAKGVEKLLDVSPTQAKQIVAGRWVQSVIVPVLELPVMPFVAVGAAWALSIVGFGWGGVLVGSVVMAWIHGKPESVRGPPNWADLEKRGAQTYGQFFVRFGVALIINSISLLAGGVPLDSLVQAQLFDIFSIDFTRLISSAYSLHAVYNFFAPEQVRLSVLESTTETDLERGMSTREIHRLTPLDFVDNMFLVKRRYHNLRGVYQTDHNITPDQLTEKIERISQFNFRIPVKNTHQANDYINMVIGMCTLDDNTPNPAPDSDLLRLVLYERAVRLIDFAEKVKRGTDLLESEKKEIRWVINIFSPLAAAGPEESNDFVFGMDIAAVLTDLTYFIDDPAKYMAKRDELKAFYNSRNPPQKGEDWLIETKEEIERGVEQNINFGEPFELRIKTVASTMVKGREKNHYAQIDNLKDLITGTIVVPLKENKEPLDWDRGVLARISRIIQTLKSVDPNSGVVSLTADELAKGEKNPDKKAEGYYHVNLYFKGMAFELQFKTPEKYVTQKVGSRGSGEGTMAHYVHKWNTFINHLSNFLFPKKMELRAHRTPFVGEFKTDFKAFWNRARRYTIVTPLDENDLKDPNKAVDVMRLPRGATTADFMAHSWVDPEFTMTQYFPAYLVGPDGNINNEALPLTSSLAMGAQITVRGPPRVISGTVDRLQIVNTSKTFRLWAKGIEPRDVEAYRSAGNEFVEFMGLAKENRAGRSAVDDDLNQFLMKHDIDFETLVLLIGEEIVTKRPFGDIAQQGVIGRLVRHFADKGFRENKLLIEQHGSRDNEALLEAVDPTLKEHLPVLTKYLDGIDELGKKEPAERAYLIGLGLWNVGESRNAQRNQDPLNGLIALPLLEPTGFGVVSVLGIGVVLGFVYPPFKNLILVVLNKVRPSFGLGRVLVGLSLMLVSGVAFGADGGVALGAMDGVGLLSLIGVAGAAVLGIKAVTSKDVETERVIRGGDNKVKRVEFGVAMLYTPLHSDGDIVPYVSYSLRNPGDNDGLVFARVKAEQQRIKDVANRINDRKDVKKKQLIEKISGRIRTAEINAQTAVVDTIDDMSVRADADQRAVLNEVKDELLRALLDNHSISHLGYSQEELARLKEGEVNKVLKALEQVAQPAEDRKNKAVGDNAAVVEDREIAKAELVQLSEIKDKTINSIKQQNTTALGALINEFREIEGFLLEAGAELEPKMKENFTQAIGNVLNAIEIVQERLAPQQISLEVARFEKALQSARSKATKGNRKSFDALNTKVPETIRQGWKAEAALSRVDGNLPQDVVLALMDELTAPPQEASGKGVIVFSQEVLTPNDMARLKQRGVRVVGIVTAGGNSGSHAAIVAQSLSIPFVTGATVAGTEAGADWAEIVTPGVFVGLDGSTGEVFVNPSDEQIRKLEELRQKLVVSEAVFESEAGHGTPLPVKASPDDRDQLAQVKDPVGLIRTEYLFNHPTLSPLLDGEPNIAFEDYLVDEFERAARLNDQQVDIRVIDNQGQEDKPLSGVPQQVGGHTGIEFLLRDPDGRKIALQEIRAIIRAYQGHRNIRMFFPLVSTLEDAENIQALVQEAVQSLPKKGTGEWDVPPLGYMIETPAGVINSGLLANRATFFNIGSTDLTRDTFHMTRNTPTLGAYLSTNRPEVTSQIMTVLRSAKAQGIEVTLCGALASSRLFWPVALALQNTHPLGLSVPPPLIPEAKYYLRRLGNQKEALGELKSLLGDPKTSADQLTQAAQAMVDIVERGIPNEESYKKAMESLAEKKRRELMQKASLVGLSVFVIGVVLLGGLTLFPLDAIAAGTHVFEGVKNGFTLGAGFVEGFGGSVFVGLGVGGHFASRGGLKNLSADLVGDQTDVRMEWRDHVRSRVGNYYSEMAARFPLSERTKTGSLSAAQLDEIFESGKKMVDGLFNSLRSLERLSIEDRKFFFESLSEEDMPEKEWLKRSRFMRWEKDPFSQLAKYFESRAVLREVGLAYSSPGYAVNIKPEGINRKNKAWLNENAPIYKMGEALMAPLVGARDATTVSEQGTRKVNAALTLLKLRARDRNQWVELDSIRGAREMAFDILVASDRPPLRIELIEQLRRLKEEPANKNLGYDGLADILFNRNGAKNLKTILKSVSALVGENTEMKEEILSWLEQRVPSEKISRHDRLVNLFNRWALISLFVFVGMPALLIMTGSTLYAIDGVGVSAGFTDPFFSALGWENWRLWEAGGMGVLLGVLNGEGAVFDRWGNGKFAKIIANDLKGVTEFNLEMDNVSVISTDGPNALVYKESNGPLKCNVNENSIDRWNGNDKSAMTSSGTNKPKFMGYTRTQLHTAVLAAMARYILNGSGASDVEQAIENVGLTEEAVRRLFTDDGANAEAIRELQNNRFVTLLFTSWAVHYSDILPIGKPGQLQMAILPKMTFDKGLNLSGLEALGKFDFGVREGESLDEELWDLAKKNHASRPPEDFKPNSLAMALHKYADESGVSAKVMKQRLAVNLLSRMSGQQMAKNETELFEMWRVLAVLFGLNGNLSEGRVKDETLKDNIRKVRRHLQNLDFTFLVNLSYTKGMELNTRTDLAEKGVEQFNRVAQEALSLRDPYQALTESFAKGEDILVYVSPRMAKGLKNDLTPAEKTQIEMLTLLSKRLVNSDDLEAAAWLEKKKRIVFAVVGTERQLSKLEISKSSLLPALIKAGADVAGLSRGADREEISLGFAKFMPENKSETVLAKSEFDKLEIDQVSLFALDVEGVTVDYSGVKDKIVSFILALAGGLMTQVAPGIVESLKKQQAVKRSA